MNDHVNFRAKAPVRVADGTQERAHATPAEAARLPVTPASQAPFNLLMMRDYFIEIVAALWGEPGHFLYPEKPSRIAFTKLQKDADSALAIYVTSAQAWNPDNPDFLPAIYVAMDDGTFSGIGAGQRQTVTNYNTAYGETDYATTASGTVRFVHEASDETEAVLLLSNTLDMLTAFAAIIRRDFCLQSFDVVGWAWPRPVGSESKPKRFKGSITCSYAYQSNWTLQQVSPRLKRLQFVAGLSPALQVKV